MWQDQAVIWQVAVFWRDFLFLALAMMLDAASGATQRLSVRLKMARRHDAMLLSFLILLAVQFLKVGDFLPNWRDPFMNFLTIPMVEELTARRHQLFFADIWTIQAIAVLSALACAFIARRQKRPVLVWLAMGYLGTLGSIVWLLMARKQHKAVTG